MTELDVACSQNSVFKILRNIVNNKIFKVLLFVYKNIIQYKDQNDILYQTFDYSSNT